MERNVEGASFRISKADGTLLRLTLIGMATDATVLQKVSQCWDHDLFPSKASQVAKWCVSYYKKFADSPKTRLIDRFQRWVDESSPSKNDLAATDKLLQSLSSQLEAHDYESAYLLDAAEQYINKRMTELLTLSLIHI